LATLEIIGALMSFLVLLGGIFGVWQSLTLKVKELEIKILNVENKINDVKISEVTILTKIDKNNDKIWNKLDSIEVKLDEKFRDLTTIKAEHDLFHKKGGHNNRD
jgi:hypothetical protein